MRPTFTRSRSSGGRAIETPRGPAPVRLRSRLLVVGAALLVACILLGCLSVGNDLHEDPLRPAESVPAGPLVGDGVLEQVGCVTVSGEAEQDVYYPVPYACPPNLTLNADADCRLMAQARDHFRVKNTHLLARTFTWKAKGIKVLITAAPANPGVVEGPARALPAEPVPVAKP